MLKQNDYLAYDMNIEEYYITVNAVTNYTTYDSDELGAIFDGNISRALKMISHSVYRYIYGVYNGLKPYNHKRFIKKKIYMDSMDETTALMFAMIEAVKGAVESGMDLNAYIDEPKATLPSTVTDELKQARLLDASEKIDSNLDIDYTAGEFSAT